MFSRNKLGPPRSKRNSGDPKIIGAVILGALVVIFFVVAFFSLFLIPAFKTDNTISRPVHDAPGVLKHAPRAPTVPRVVDFRSNVSCPRGFHAQQPLGSDHEVCITRMPYPKSVDNELVDYQASPCDSFARYACGMFEGHRNTESAEDSIIDLSFGTAQRGASRMFDAVVRMDAQQIERSAKNPPTERAPGGVIHDFVLSCVYSNARPNSTDDLTFAHETLAYLDAPANFSDDFQNGWSVGSSVALGDEGAMSVTTVMNPASNRETVIYWSGGQQLRMLPLVSPGDMRMAMRSACTILTATGQFPFSEWTTADECADANYRLFYSLAHAFIEHQDEASTLTYEYFRTGIYEDMFSLEEIGDRAGSRDFVKGVLAGLHNVIAVNTELLADNGIGLPQLEQLRHWMMLDTFMQFVVNKAKEIGPVRWRSYNRVMMIVNDFQYSDALLNHGNVGENLVRGAAWAPVKTEHPTVGLFGMKTGDFQHHVFGLGHNPSHHGVEAAPRVRVAKDEKAQTLLRDEWVDESELINSEMYERCSYLAAMHLPELTDNMFARLAVPEERRTAAEDMTGRMIRAVADDIDASLMLSPAAKSTLRKSIEAIQPRVGTPWHSEPPPSLNYDVNPHSSMLRNAKKIRQRNIAQDTFEALLFNGQPANKRRSMAHHFDMSSSAVNAYFDPSRPSISVLPAILAAPFFSEKYSAVSKAARLGSLVGHELTHRTDSNSKFFDEEGNLGHEWMPAEMMTRYGQVEQCFTEQYGSYVTPNGNPIDGTQTLGENMADTMGTRAALRSLEADLGRPATRDELKEFALSFAQMWCSATTPEEEAERARDDPHAPAAARIDGVLRNLETPAGKHVMKEVFNCPAGSPMHPEKICKVW